jgi:hypothetical protein
MGPKITKGLLIKQILVPKCANRGTYFLFAVTANICANKANQQSDPVAEFIYPSLGEKVNSPQSGIYEYGYCLLSGSSPVQNIFYENTIV